MPAEGEQLSALELLAGIDVPGLRGAVQARLFGSPGTDDAPPRRSAGRPARGSSIGRYVVLDLLGQGGMGVVYSAYDPELDRKVALKLLRGREQDDGRAEAGRARIVREAQALAKLSHPNVVTVFDAGTHEDEVFLAMEYVHGETLRAWLARGPWPWPRLLEVLVAAGRGLAAAHAAGILHRDFKPENVMIAADAAAVVRVMDFGLARRSGANEDTPAEANTPRLFGLREEMTHTGQLLGTPGYISAELFAGRGVDERADQYAFCVTVWEAMYGKRPFRAVGLLQLAAAVCRGHLPRPPTGTRVPGWLHRAIARGLAPDPDARWPSMDALLAELARGQQRTRRRRLVAGLAAGALVGAAVLGAAWLGRRARVQACEQQGAALAEVWNDDARAQLATSYVRLDSSLARWTAGAVEHRLDEYVTSWQRERTAACLDDELHGRWTDAEHTASTWCFDEQRLELAAVVEHVLEPSPETVLSAISSVADLSPSDRCSDRRALARAPAPPTQLHTDMHELRVELSRARVLASATPDTVATEALLARAEELGWPPITARVRLVLATQLRSSDRLEQAEAAAASAFHEAARADAWDVAADAAIDRARTALHRQRFEDGLTWTELAATATARAGGNGSLRDAQQLDVLGRLYEMHGDHDLAQDHSARALEAFRVALGEQHPLVATHMCTLGVTYRARSDYPSMRALCARALELARDTLGPDHPETAGIALRLAVSYAETGDYAVARALYEPGLATVVAARGPSHSQTAHFVMNLGIVAKGTGDYARARAYYERALATREATLGPEHPRVATTLRYLGELLLVQGELATATLHLERASGIMERARGADHLDVPQYLQALASARAASGDFAAARVLHERALAIAEPTTAPVGEALVHVRYGDALRLAGDREGARRHYTRALELELGDLGPDHVVPARTSTRLAELELEDARPVEALARLEQAVPSFASGFGILEDEHDARFALARALVATDGDRLRAQALASSALAGYQAAPGNRPERPAEIAAWLSANFPAIATR